jgi:hypothetical protein
VAKLFLLEHLNTNYFLEDKKMKTTKVLTILFVASCLMLWAGQFAMAGPVGTAFTYQGRLIDANEAADGSYDFQFKLFDANTGGNKLGADVNKSDVDVIDGYFTVELDFGSVFDGNACWLDIGVRPGEQSDPNVYTTLSPRQQLTPTPYALYAKSAQTAGSDNDWMISGNDMYSIPSGNVGIGTMSPEKKLDIASEGYTGLGICLTNNSPGGTSWDIDNDGGVFKIVEHAGCGPEFINNTRIAVIGNCIGSPYGGNIGIGTDTPGSALNVEGTIWGRGGHACSNGDCPPLPPKVGVYGESDTGDGVLGISISGYAGRFIGDVKVESDVHVSGNIGVGTSTPARNLHVSDVMRLQPRDTAPIDAAEGDIYMDSFQHKLMVYDGSMWQACW